MRYLGLASENPARPLTVLFGGAKISDKIAVARRLMEKLDVLLVGGGMCATFFKAMGLEIGRSIFEEDSLEFVSGIMAQGEQGSVTVALPRDVVVAKEFDANATPETVLATQMPPDSLILDIGPETVALFKDYIIRAKTVFWNGPMGVYEFRAFSYGTRQMAQALADSRCHNRSWRRLHRRRCSQPSDSPTKWTTYPRAAVHPSNSSAAASFPVLPHLWTPD